MNITDDQVMKIASLAKLEFSGDELTKMAQDISRIIAYASHLAELDGIPSFPCDIGELRACPLRDDVPASPVEASKQLRLLSAAPDGQVIVPPIFPGGGLGG